MNFYATIHPWYDQIFPFAMAQRDFVLSFGSGPELELVDVGCGTGSLLVSLAGSFGRCTGLDPDEEMLAGARAKADSAGVPIRLMPGGMLDLDREFAPGSVDRLICFGNTIPHLESLEQVDHFLRQAASVLRPEGMILLQIIHFRRIFDQELPGLPTLENDQVRFVRNYHYTLPDPGVIRLCIRYGYARRYPRQSGCTPPNLQIYRGSLPDFCACGRTVPDNHSFEILCWSDFHR